MKSMTSTNLNEKITCIVSAVYAYNLYKKLRTTNNLTWISNVQIIDYGLTILNSSKHIIL